MEAVLNLEPNWHPVFVHFAVGLLMTASLVILAVALMPTGYRIRESLGTGGDWMLAFGVAAAALAVVAGFQAYYTVAHGGSSHAAMTEHRNWALVTLAVFLLIGVWRYLRRDRTPSILFALVLLATAGLLTVTAWHGGRLVFHYGLGVAGLPQMEGPGHDHDHGNDHAHSDDESSAVPVSDSGNESKSRGGHAHGSDGDGHPSNGHDHGPDTSTGATGDSSSPGRAGAVPARDPKAVVAAFHDALARKDESAVYALLLPDVFVFESGNAERSMSQYAGHHMPADMEFSSSVERSLQNQRVVKNGDTTWVLSEAISRGTFRGQDILSRTMETMILRRTDLGWRIAHIHWSSSRIREEPVPDSDQEHTDGHDHEH